ncbi:MAG: alanine--tRNA ligase [Firmicutes bacterium]|nr:alanine--tRNA ligase [Bacillota bacterium]MCL1954032.1 alanine--tRNA ligase [Bacillota bacterium]
MHKITTSQSLRQAWYNFFESKQHAIISGASLIPQNDPTVLFTTAGMHPLVPYLMGQKHPAGVRLANVQRCVRTGDIEEVGDSSHCTFFEMMGNWSLGDYFKKESIAFSFEFLTKVLGLTVSQLAVSVFEGDIDAPKDIESAEIWASHGIPKDKIFYLPKSNNWWGPAGITGPCGPDTEIFLDNGQIPCSPNCNPACDCGKYLEIWNNVFMQYNKTIDGKFEQLSQKNVDTGMGLERTLVVLTGANTVYDTDLFVDAIAMVQKLSGKVYGNNDTTDREIRIVVDHIRTATMIVGDELGIVPSNTDQGYILRRLLRRAIRYAIKLNLPKASLSQISQCFVNVYSIQYPQLLSNQKKIIQEIDAEEERFVKTISQGIVRFEKLVQNLQGDTISGKAAFNLYDTYGFPLEMTQELAKENNLKVNVDGYYQCFEQHQSKSQQGATQKFKGGLQDNSQATTRLHTATHLLHKALKTVLKDENLGQKGSNITAERLRFDFNFSRPLSQDEIDKVQEMVNNAIQDDLPISFDEMTVQQAKDSGAIGLFGDRYQEIVKVYSIGDFSCEICGGPHANRTSELGKFEIVKEQSSSSGVRRIKAVLK